MPAYEVMSATWQNTCMFTACYLITNCVQGFVISLRTLLQYGVQLLVKAWFYLVQRQCGYGYVQRYHDRDHSADILRHL